MDVTWMENKHIQLLKNDSGQSTVEYILLMAVITTLVAALYESDAFQDFFGENGKFAKAYREELQYNYRHALFGRGAIGTRVYGTAEHDSYSGVNGEATRFFGPLDKYPK